MRATLAFNGLKLQTLQDHSASDLVLYALKRKCPNAEIFRVEVSPNIRVQGQISTPSDLSVFRYS